MHLSLFTSFMTPSSPLPTQQQPVSTLVLCICPPTLYTFVSLYILHDTFFTTTCTTTVCKYSCFYPCVHPLYVPFIGSLYVLQTIIPSFPHTYKMKGTEMKPYEIKKCGNILVDCHCNLIPRRNILRKCKINAFYRCA